MAEKQLPKLFLSKFSKTIEHIPSQSITIISAADEGVVFGIDSQFGGLLDSYPGGIHIFTEKLVLNQSDDGATPAFASHVSPFVNLAASEIEVNGISPAVISVSGANGIANAGGGLDNEPATHGGHGNTLNIYLQHLPSEDLPLRFDAKGGTGATTDNLKTPAGRGGNGANINIIGHTNAAEILHRLQEYSLTWNLPSDWSDQDQQEAKAIPREDLRLAEISELLHLARVTMSSANDGKLLEKVVTPLESLQQEVGCTIYTITAAINEAISSITDSIDEQRLVLFKSCAVSGGPGGPAAFHTAQGGINGRPGDIGNRSVLVTTGTTFPQCPGFVFVHPLHCEMLLEKARAFFYFGDKTSCDRAQQTLRSIIQKITALFDQDSMALKQTWDLFEKQKQILGLSSTADLSHRFNGILKEAKSMLFQLTCTTIDYYSLREDWAPRFTASTFDEETDKSLTQLAELETTYSEYSNALQSNTVSKEMREVLVARSQSTQTGISAQMTQLEENLALLRKKIHDPENAFRMRELRHEVDVALEELRAKVKYTFTLSMKQLTDAAIDFAKEPSKESAAKAGGKLAWDAITKVPDDSGVAVDKSLLLSGVDSISGNLQQKIKEVATSKNSGEMSGDESSGKMLVVEQQELEKLFKSFSTAEFADDVKSTIEIVKSYVDLVTSRNSNIVEYNFTLKAILESRAKQTSLSQGRLALQKQSTSAPSLSQLSLMTAMIDEMYTTSRARVMKLISYYRRAINFSSLSEPDTLALGGFNSEAALNLTCIQLRYMKSQLRSQLFELQDKRGSDATSYPDNYKKGPGKFFFLSQTQLKRLLTREVLEVRIPTVYRSYSGPSQEFAGCADVRVYRARFYLDGLKTSDRAAGKDVLVQISLRHSGDNDFVDVNNQLHHFRHNPISFSWSYRLRGKEVVQAMDSGVLVNFSGSEKEGGKAYAAPSPFTTWTISLEFLAKEDLDLSEVKGGKFEFFGTSRSFL